MTSYVKTCIFAVVISLGLVSGDVWGQTTSSPPSTSETAAPATDISKQGGDLSDKLSSTNGVIRPEETVDPKMQKAAPSAGTTPVLPPPGSPGGATNIQPK